MVLVQQILVGGARDYGAFAHKTYGAVVPLELWCLCSRTWRLCSCGIRCLRSYLCSRIVCCRTWCQWNRMWCLCSMLYHLCSMRSEIRKSCAISQCCNRVAMRPGEGDGRGEALSDTSRDAHTHTILPILSSIVLRLQIVFPMCA